MSYAQQHRSRVELHHGEPEQLVATSATAATRGEVHEGDVSVTRSDGPPSRLPQPLGGNIPQRTASSLLRAGSSQLHHSHAAAIDIAAWSEAASTAGAGERQPFQLLQHTPSKNEPPRLRASRKQFASPRASAAASEGEQSIPVSHAIIVGSESPPSLSNRDAAGALLATDLRGESAQQPAAVVPEEHSRAVPPSSEQKEPPRVGELSPPPILVPQHPGMAATSSSLPSSARLSIAQWPASETFTARLHNIIETRQQIEALVQKQREDEQELVLAIATLDEQAQQPQLVSPRTQLRQHEQQQASSPSAAEPRSAERIAVDRHVYEQALHERTAALAALREFKEKGNVIVHKLYDTVKSQQDQSLELVATVEALKKANKRLKEAVSNGHSGTASLSKGSASGAPASSVAELQQKVATQRHVIEQMDQLMQNADRMLLAMRARVEAAERRAASATADRRQLPPLPKVSPRTGASGDAALTSPAAVVATPDAVAAIERLAERYGEDPDVATVAAQQQLLLERIAQLRQALKQEEAQRLHLEEVYGATSEETARSVALLEERLQRAENLRGLTHSSSNGVSVSTALRQEHNAVPEEEKLGEPLARQETAPGAKGNDAGEEAATPSDASSQASSSSATPNRTLFTAMSVEDGAATNLVDEAAPEDEAPQQPEAAPVTIEKPKSAATDTTPSPVEDEPRELMAAQQSAMPEVKQPRAYLTRRRSSTERDTHENGVRQAKVPLGIPIPEASSLGGSLRRSFNSRSSSASRRLVDFRPTTGADATSQELGSSGGEEDDNDGDVVRGTENATVRASHSNAAALTGITPTVTPTAIHSASSPLLDTSTAAERSAVRQRRMHQQMEELDRLEVDVTDVVRSLNVD